MLRRCLIAINRHYLCSMFDCRIDGEEMSDKFLLMHGRYNERNGAFENPTVGKGDCQAVSQRSCRRREYTFSRLDFLNFVNGVSGKNKERIYHKLISVNPIVDTEQCHQDECQHHKTDNCRPYSVIHETRNNAAHRNQSQDEPCRAIPHRAISRTSKVFHNDFVLLCRYCYLLIGIISE